MLIKIDKNTSEGFIIQVRVIKALVFREIITRFGRKGLGFMWLFIEPMLFTAFIVVLWSYIRHRNTPIPIIPFAVTGYSSVLLWRNMASKCLHAIEPNMALLYHHQVKIIDLIIARIILETAGATISFMFLTLTGITLGIIDIPQDISQILIGWFMLIWFGASLALTLATIAGQNKLVERLWQPISYVLFPLSGAAFMVDWLPKSMQDIILLLPMVHGLELVRDGYFGNAVKTHYDIAYMASACLLLTTLGLAKERVIGKKITPE